MVKRRGFLLMIISLMLALGAAWVARKWVAVRLNGGPAQPQMEVVVADTDIPFGEKVDSRYLGVLSLPAGTPLAPHFSDPKDVVGLVALQQVQRGEILLQRQFAKHPPGSMLSTVLKPGMRAISVPVNEVVGVAGFLLPGNYVDVLESRMQGNTAVTHTVLQDLQVLAVDQTDSHEKDQPIVVHAVTLEVSPKQADSLVTAMTEGRIQLTLRGANAGEAPPVQEPPKVHHPVRVVRVFDHKPAPHPIIIIRGIEIQRANKALAKARTTS